MISVIVPVYNAEKFLDKCIESILSQTFTDFEAILVNDGSTDKSGEICDIWAQKDSRIKVIHQQNSGVSVARNNGISAAKGEYIAFVDSDDSINCDYLKLLYSNIDGHDLAVGATCMHIIRENKQQILAVSDKSYTLWQFKKDMRHTFQGQYINSPVNKLFKTDIIKNNNLTFDPSMNLGEDCVFCLSYMENCSKVKCFSDIIYNYNVHTNYVRSESYVKNRFADRTKMCNVQKEFYKQDTTYYYKRILSEYMHIAYYETLDNKSIQDHGRFVADYINENNLTELIKKANYNILDSKIFFKLACEMLAKADSKEEIKL